MPKIRTTRTKRPPEGFEDIEGVRESSVFPLLLLTDGTIQQCCFTTYERTLDSVVGLFVPFYNEIKSLVIVFFLLTRARVRIDASVFP